MKSDTLFYQVLNWLGLGGKISFTNYEKSEETDLTEYTDIFGNQLHKNEKVLPILYNEITRCGYVTIGPEYDRQAIEAYKLNDYYIKRGVIKYADFLDGLDNRRGLVVEESHRRGFFHVYTPIGRVLEQYRHRTA